MIKIFEEFNNNIRVGYYVKFKSVSDNDGIYRVTQPGQVLKYNRWYIERLDQDNWNYANGDDLVVIAKNDGELELYLALNKYNI